MMAAILPREATGDIGEVRGVRDVHSSGLHDGRNVAQTFVQAT